MSGVRAYAAPTVMSPTKIRVPEAPADLKEKRSQWQRAAEAGDSEAMNSLGILYSQWAETPHLEAARRWFERAADAGNGHAMSNLGALYSGLQQPDVDVARHWYERGADAGNSNACLISSARDG